MHDLLSVELRGDLIIVAQPGTSFSATYGKAKDEPNIVLLASTEGRTRERQALNQFRAGKLVERVALPTVELPAFSELDAPLIQEEVLASDRKPPRKAPPRRAAQRGPRS